MPSARLRLRGICEAEHAAAMATVTIGLAEMWGDDRAALARVSAPSVELAWLHQQEGILVRERDELVRLLRQTGSTWAGLSSRTNLSRQALMKRL